jgi:transmembrane sensor
VNTPLHDITDDLLVKFLLKETSPAENKRVALWVDASDANKKYLDDFMVIWQESKKLENKIEVDENLAWQKFQQRLAKKERTKVLYFNKKVLMQLAAILILYAAGVLFYYQYIKANKPHFKMLVIKSVQQTKTDTLPDASVVVLNKNSSLSYPSAFHSAQRKVTLTGEAFFTISPDKKKPFIITVNDVTVQVVGTSFNVKNRNGITEIIVETGVVQVLYKNKMIELRPKEKISITAGNTMLHREVVTDRLYNYYRSKILQCDATPLWKVTEALSQAYGTYISIDDKTLVNLPLTATFNNEPLDTVLHVIAQTFNLKVIKNGSHIVLNK